IANNIAEIYSDQGRIAEAEELLREVQRTCAAAGSLLMSAVATAYLGRAAARAAGRADEARELLGSALTTLQWLHAARFAYGTQVSTPRPGHSSIRCTSSRLPSRRCRRK